MPDESTASPAPAGSRFSQSRAALATLALASTLLSVGVLSVAGEAFLRYRERTRETVPGTQPFLYYPHRQLGHALVRNTDYYGWMHVNGQGFRGTRDVALQPPADRLRILVVGGSTTFDSFVSSDSATWPARLEHWLGRADPAHPVEVINAGVPGYRVEQDLIRLVLDLSRYRPDVLVFLQGHNDLFGTLNGIAWGDESADRRPGHMPVVTPWGRWLAEHSLLYTKLETRFQILRFRGRSEDAGAKDEAARRLARALDEGTERFRGHVSAYLAVARTLDAEIVVPQLVHLSGMDARSASDSLEIKSWWYSIPAAPPEVVFDGYRRFDEVLRQAAETAGAHYVPTRDFGLTGPRWYVTLDPIHFSDAGADQMGRRMAEELVKRGVLARAAARRAQRGSEEPAASIAAR